MMQNGLFGSKYKMSMMAVCTSMCKFSNEHAKLLPLDRRTERQSTICVMKNEMRTVGVQNFHIAIIEMCKNECGVVR